jgi:hypothetical protein
MPDKRGRIFVSYRRADSAAVVDHLYDRLVAKYGRKCVFRDIDNIPLGMDFREHIRSVIDECDIVLAVIGRNWTGGKSASVNRIMRADDPVRIEIEEGLKARALVVPVLVGGAHMPTAASLPPSLEEFPARNAATLATGLDFNHHIGSLFAKLDEYLKQCGKTVVPRPDWMTPAVAAAATLAVAPPLLFASSALFGIPFSGGVVTVGVFVMTLAAALATALFIVDAFLSGRIGWSQPQQRPLLAGVLLFLLAMPAWYWAGDRLAAAIPIQEPSHLSKQLLAAYREALSGIELHGKGDFGKPRQIVAALRTIDPEDGSAWYFSGEITRRSNTRLFDSDGCFRGWPKGETGSVKPYQRDFERYRDNAERMGGAAMTTWDAPACYEGNGYCGQRFAWVHHLMAYDYLVTARSESGAVRIATLNDAKAAVAEALRFRRPDGGAGFDQCMDDGVMAKQIDAELARPAGA